MIAIAIAGFTVSTALAKETKSYELDEVDQIDIAAGVSAKVEIGEEQSIIVETDKGDFEDLIIRVEDGVLYIKQEWKNNFWNGRKRPNYKVTATVKDLKSIEASSGSSLAAEGINDGDFTINVSSGSSVRVEGTCGVVSAEASSGASLNAKEFRCENAAADASSGASLSLFASTKVDAKASSGSSVKVYGSPEDVNARKSSGGSISIRD